MTVTDNVFPQSGDADFAENFATLLGRGNVSSYVETGMQFTVDYTNDVVDISQGKAFAIVDEATISSNSETRLVLDYAVTTAARTGIALNVNETNNLIYLNPNVGTNDGPSFEVETDSGLAGANWVLIGVIDTLNDTAEERNRSPSADFTTLTARKSFSVPVYSDPADAESSEGSVIYVSESASFDGGLYIDEGNGYHRASRDVLTDLNNVSGIEGFDANTSVNRPSAGTAGRIFVDTSNDSIQLDDGNTWTDIGTNPSNISAGDLGFDTATQLELDNHAAITDIHHTRPSAGNGLKDQSNTFNFEPAEITGLFTEDDGNDNIAVQIGFGLENDGSGQIQFDEDAAYTLTSQFTMSSDIDLQNNNLIEPNEIQTGGGGADSITIQDTANVSSIMTLNEGGEVEINSGDLTDGTNVIWDASLNEIPDSAMGSVDNSTLTNDSVTLGGNTVSLGGSSGISQIDGTVVNRTEAITNLPGDIYVTALGATDPTVNDGDLWFQYE